MHSSNISMPMRSPDWCASIELGNLWGVPMQENHPRGKVEKVDAPGAVDKNSMDVSRYFDATALRREYLFGDAFLAKYTTISRDFIWQEQNERFKRLLGRAWRMQFYRKLWGEHGIKPGDIRSLLDIEKLPVFDSTYLSSAQEDPALFGDVTGQDSYSPGFAPPLIDKFFGPRGAEVSHQLFARAAMLQGTTADEIAQFLLCPKAGRDAIRRLHSTINHCYSIDCAGLIAVEGIEQDVLYLMEDAHYVEIIAPLTQIARADGAAGELVLTTLFKDDLGPLIRFNTHDKWLICPAAASPAAASPGEASPGESSLNLNLRRIQRPLAPKNLAADTSADATAVRT